MKMKKKELLSVLVTRYSTLVTCLGQLSPFGGLVETPVLDRLARNGLRYTNMHATEVCLPTEAYFERLSSFRTLIW